MWMDRVHLDPPGSDTLTDEDGEVTEYVRETSTYSKNPFEMEDVELHQREENDDFTCGIWTWSPPWLQKFASSKTFTVMYTFASLLQGMVWAYFTSTISTFEKRFGVTSTSMGLLISANEMAQLSAFVICSCFGLRRRNPLLLLAGVCCSTLSLFLLASPHIFFGSGKPALDLAYHYAHAHSEDSSGTTTLATTNTTMDYTTSFELTTIPSELTTEEPDIVTTIVTTTMNGSISSLSTTEIIATTSSMEDIATEGEISRKLRSVDGDNLLGMGEDEMEKFVELCHRDAEWMDGSPHTSSNPLHEGSASAYLFFLFAQFLSGVGVWLFSSLGGLYSENEVLLPKEVPLIYGLSTCIRMLGALIGYVLAGTCLTVYISPSHSSHVPSDHIRWLGAWWLGWVLLAIFMTALSFILMLFPFKLVKSVLKKNSVSTDSGISMLTIPASALFLGLAECSIANFLPPWSKMSRTLQALLSNKIHLYLTFSLAMHLFCFVGYASFMPKYIEITFNKTIVNAIGMTCLINVAAPAIGLILSGSLISKFLPSASKLLGWSVFISTCTVLSTIIFTQFGCDSSDSIDLGQRSLSSPWSYSMLKNCSSDCNCRIDNLHFVPVCDENAQKLYFSPCHAGCEVMKSDELFQDCSCSTSEDKSMTSGFCSEAGCSAGFVAFIVMSVILQMSNGASAVGRMLVTYRCTKSEGRTALIGLTLLVVLLISFIPSPLVFGRLFDASCLLWNRNSHDDSKHCVLYSAFALRYSFNLFPVAFLIGATIFEGRLWRSGLLSNLRLYESTIEVEPRRRGRRDLNTPSSSHQNGTL